MSHNISILRPGSKAHEVRINQGKTDMKCRHIWIEGPTWKQCGQCGSWAKVKEKPSAEAKDKDNEHKMFFLTTREGMSGMPPAIKS